MDHELLVRIRHRGADRQEKLEALDHGQLPSVCIDVDRFALDVLHDEVRQTVVGGPTIEETSDVRMVERGEDLTLGAEARQHTIRVHAPPDQLDRDALLILLVGALGEIDGTHAAVCDLVEQMVGADAAVHR